MMEFKRDREPPKSLAEYLNCADYNGLMKNRGKGIRKWRMVENKEWTFRPDFLEKLNEKISKWTDRNLAARSLAALKDKQEEGNKSQDPPQFIWVKGLRYRYDPEGKYNQVPPPPSYVQVKQEIILAEDVVDHQRSLTFTKDVCVGTDDYWAGTKVASSSSEVKSSSPLQPQSQLPSILGSLNCLQHTASPPPRSSPPSQLPSLLGPLPCIQQAASEPQPLRSQPQPPPLLGSTPYVPPHRQQQVAQSSSSTYQRTVVDDSGIDTKEYEKVISGIVEKITGKPTDKLCRRKHKKWAKSWTPKNMAQRIALEQVKLDIFNVLVVGKGCALKYLINKLNRFKGEFYRVTEENLDLSKIGVPDLRTLLVQMTPDMIYFRRERYTGNIYVFPNLANNQFETVAHIGELVAEQRKDKNFMIPDESVLYECDITELFQLPEWRQQQQQYSLPFQSSYYGSYNPNYNYNDYTNYYYARMQPGGTQDYNQYLQSVTQRINQYYAQTQQYYGNNGYRQYGNNYYRH